MFIDPFFKIVLGFVDVMFSRKSLHVIEYMPCFRNGYVVFVFRDVSEIFSGLWRGLYP